eukprot:CAMPEP_0114614370 /NCGR_PEP_ID=MMETSP0168-20121206/5620_1 /TAXON_ID=95228 ORGANISM="Vannella sp., Strain DIVA3 517/6/12" /NCGR_SAMPLE_ID=MMETSP0168 /ASSEMBLY_ACC=CAM_ASM_000044 /LENGTH=830 /DNA_ID=CAMNT_0001825419 /DNA_START=166 /DNA_END=2655 /DNA_ORIENTATION=+
MEKAKAPRGAAASPARRPAAAAASPARSGTKASGGTPKASKGAGMPKRGERTKYKAATPTAARGTPTKSKRGTKVAQSEPPLRVKQTRKARMDSFELSPAQGGGSRTPMYSSGSKPRRKVGDSSALSQQAQELLSTILEDSHDGGYSSSSSADFLDDLSTRAVASSRSTSVSASPAGGAAVSRARDEGERGRTAAAVSAKRKTAAAVAATARAATGEKRTPTKRSTPAKTTTTKAKPAASSKAAAATPSKAAKAGPKASMESAPRGPEDGSESVYSDGFSYVHEILRLEGELKSKEHQLAGLVQETCRMERLLSKKEEALFELSVELHQAQETILQLDTTGEAAAKHKAISADALKELLARKEERDAEKEEAGDEDDGDSDSDGGGGSDAEGAADGARRKERKARRKAKGKKASSLDRLEQEFRNISSKRSPTISYNATLPEDLYHHVMDLDNELAERERECTKLRDENRQYSLRNKELHMYYKRAVVELRDYKETKEELFLTEKHELEEKVRALTRREKELVHELRATRGSDRTKAQVIKSLEEKVEHEEALEKKLKHMRVELKQAEQRVAALRSECSRQKKIIARKDQSLAKADAVQEAGIPFHLWKEERTQLMIKLKQLKEAKERNERTLERQKLRIHELCDRIDLIASSLYEDPRNVTAARRAELINGSRRFPSRANTTTRRGGGGGGAPAPPLIIDDSDTDVEEAELTEDLLEFDDDSESASASSRAPSTLDADGTISIRLYHLLEQEVRSMHQVIAERDAVIADKDAAIESLNRELASLSRTKVVRSQEETEKLREQLSSVEAENRTREKQYRLKLHKMQAKLE